MLRAVVQFFGNKVADFGRPQPLHCYSILAETFNKDGHVVVQAFALTPDTPDLGLQGGLIAITGNEEAAFKQLLQRLGGLSHNQDLQRLIFRPESN